MKFEIIPVTPLKQNCSLLICEHTNKAVLVDPGGNVPLIVNSIKKLGVSLEKILLTHGHLDHCGGAFELSQKYGVLIEGPHFADKFWLDSLTLQTIEFGFGEGKAFLPHRWLNEGDIIVFGRERLNIFHCPGHTPGHIVFFNKNANLAIVGDILFAGSIGRTDFPLGNQSDLIRSIQTKLWPMGEDVAFIPGHGPMSTFLEERKNNRYVADHLINRKDK